MTMAATALKRKRRDDLPVVAAPAIADDRLALHDAIQRKRKADEAAEAQRTAIARAQGLASSADDDIETLRGKIEAADESDVARAASFIKIDKPVIAAWSGESARTAVERAERHLEVTKAALKRLHKDLAALQDAAAVCANVVIIEANKLLLPLVEQLVAQLRADRARVAITSRVLAELVADDTRIAPRFSENSVYGLRASEERVSPFAALKSDVQSLLYGPTADQHTAAYEAVAAVKAARLALLSDASAALPELMKG
jgi:hypothetical protein